MSGIKLSCQDMKQVGSFLTFRSLQDSGVDLQWAEFTYSRGQGSVVKQRHSSTAASALELLRYHPQTLSKLLSLHQVLWLVAITNTGL